MCYEKIGVKEGDDKFLYAFRAAIDNRPLICLASKVKESRLSNSVVTLSVMIRPLYLFNYTVPLHKCVYSRFFTSELNIKFHRVYGISSLKHFTEFGCRLRIEYSGFFECLECIGIK